MRFQHLKYGCSFFRAEVVRIDFVLPRGRNRNERMRDGDGCGRELDRVLRAQISVIHGTDLGWSKDFLANHHPLLQVLDVFGGFITLTRNGICARVSATPLAKGTGPAEGLE
jgi:hypothetical protein